jgi:hypothetical protein
VGQDAGILSQEAPGKPWQTVIHGEEIFTGDLLVGFRAATIDTPNKAVQIRLWGDNDKESPIPIFEPAVRLHKTPGFDLDLTLDRGRVDLTNLKKEGSARVRLRIWNFSMEGTLEKPGTRLALEMYGRWPKGTRFLKNPGPKDVPVMDVFALVISGEVLIKAEDGIKTYRLAAPPGPALLHGSNREDEGEPIPVFLKELPLWANPERPLTERGKKVSQFLDQFRNLIKDRSLGEAIDTFLISPEPIHQGIAMIAIGGTDDLNRLGKILRDPKTPPELWEFAIRVLRHWLGRCPGQDLKLYQRLTEVGKMKRIQAAIVLNLLHSFSDEDLAHAEVFETLIDFLDSPELAIRGLAYWHLSRLVPAGRKIGYHPQGPQGERQEAQKKWRQLIPPGKLPPKPSTTTKNRDE